MKTQNKPAQLVELGNTGIKVSYLAIGTGTEGYSHSSRQTRKDPNWLTEAIIDSYDLGISFWDLADLYGSHPFAKKALKKFNRNDIVIMTKTQATNYKGCKKDIDLFLKEIGTDYLDMVLLHCKIAGDWNVAERGAMDALSEAKAAGKIRAVGISAHSYQALETAVNEPWVEVLLARYNYDGAHMDGEPAKIEKIIRAARENGQGTIAMKVLGEGSLSSDPEKAIRFVAETDCVDAMTIGYMSHDEMRQCAGIVDRFRK